MYKLVVIVGPTAVGKSSTAVTLAKDFKGEVINGDSIQVYRQLAIGSAKTTEAEMQGVPHHLIDYKDVNDEYSVQLFQKDGRQKIEEIVGRGHLPIIAGGTGLYIKALLY
ncbi:MAG: tRNA (adenosine(37)-N6)-dimethylallyltransferase MiaA, partial [Erysipelotrichaceae bacterium]|nr:tRNA (adenosine(37)-N6)-dimethylallyltransferase MiaA [Erysipelotrichaceae bacterium]